MRAFSSYALSSLVDSPYPGIPDRIVTPTERTELSEIAEGYERALIPAQRSEIEEAVAMLSLAYPALKATPQEAAARIELYAQALSDLPPSVLQAACMSALRECRFFPSVSEIRERSGDLSKMRWRLSRMRHLIAKHDAEWREPEPEEKLSDEDQSKVDAWLKSHGIEASS